MRIIKNNLFSFFHIRELNELVSSHHQQLVAWEVDRQRVSEKKNRNQKIKYLKK